MFSSNLDKTLLYDPSLAKKAYQSNFVLSSTYYCTICKNQSEALKTKYCQLCKKFYCNICCSNDEHKKIDPGLHKKISNCPFLNSLDSTIYNKIKVEAPKSSCPDDETIYKLLFEISLDDFVEAIVHKNFYGSGQFLFYKIIAESTHSQTEKNHAFCHFIKSSETEFKVSDLLKVTFTIQDHLNHQAQVDLEIDPSLEFLTKICKVNRNFESKVGITLDQNIIRLKKDFCHTCSRFHPKIPFNQNLFFTLSIFLSKDELSEGLSSKLSAGLKNFIWLNILAVSAPILILMRKYSAAYISTFFMIFLASLFSGILPYWLFGLVFLTYGGSILNGIIYIPTFQDPFQAGKQKILLIFAFLTSALIVNFYLNASWIGASMIAFAIYALLMVVILVTKNKFIAKTVQKIRFFDAGENSFVDSINDIEKKPILECYNNINTYSLQTFFQNLDSEGTLYFSNTLIIHKKIIQKCISSCTILEDLNTLVSLIIVIMFCLFLFYDTDSFQGNLNAGTSYQIRDLGNFYLPLLTATFYAVFGLFLKIPTGYSINTNLDASLSEFDRIKEVLSAIKIAPSLIFYDREYFKPTNTNINPEMVYFTNKRLSEKCKKEYLKETTYVLLALENQLKRQNKNNTLTYLELVSLISDLAQSSLNKLEAVKIQYIDFTNQVSFKLFGLKIDKKLVVTLGSVVLTAGLTTLYNKLVSSS